MLKYDERGLLPAIVQSNVDGRVLMLGWMNAESLALTLESGEVWFFSRSRNALWHKGATSGNFLRVVQLVADCDEDAVLVLAVPAGPTCHTGRDTCFWHDTLGNVLSEEETP
jgi:phosphoribosyl-ATP pyrophosphohydrolase/phosphoribosyl-AMP cyclohydrolase